MEKHISVFLTPKFKGWLSQSCSNFFPLGGGVQALSACPGRDLCSIYLRESRLKMLTISQSLSTLTIVIFWLLFASPTYAHVVNVLDLKLNCDAGSPGVLIADQPKTYICAIPDVGNDLNFQHYGYEYHQRDGKNVLFIGIFGTKNLNWITTIDYALVPMSDHLLMTLPNPAPPGVLVNQGFLTNFVIDASLSTALAELRDNGSNPDEVVIVGHSQGAAYANFLAIPMYFERLTGIDSHKITQVVTFGSPLVGNEAWQSWYNDSGEFPPTLRYANAYDYTTTVPSVGVDFATKYYHVGQDLTFRHQNGEMYAKNHVAYWPRYGFSENGEESYGYANPYWKFGETQTVQYLCLTKSPPPLVPQTCVTGGSDLALPTETKSVANCSDLRLEANLQDLWCPNADANNCPGGTQRQPGNRILSPWCRSSNIARYFSSGASAVGITGLAAASLGACVPLGVSVQMPDPVCDSAK